LIDEFLCLPSVVQFIIVLGAGGLLRSYWLDTHAPVECGHTWGRGHELKSSEFARMQHRKCKSCGATQLRYKHTRRGSWYMRAPIESDDLLPIAKVVER
jgi:hypothetical protein